MITPGPNLPPLIMNWPIRYRLALAFGAILTALGLTAVTTWLSLNSLSESVQAIYEDHTVAGTELAKTSTALLRYRNQIIQILGVQTEAELAEIKESLTQYRADIDATIQTYQNHPKRVSGIHDEAKELA
ncbi:MAG: MCP four helix bundle domain-containing protein, partial [Nitrospira sp.]|nr:MCP four helix bundle domain-containing protein [Nitrospira sp.]